MRLAQGLHFRRYNIGRKPGERMMADWITDLSGDEARALLSHDCRTIDRGRLSLPGPDFVDRVCAVSDRNPRVLRSLQTLFGHGRLAGTGYVSILPVDQGVEHSAGASFAVNPDYFDPENIVRLAMEGGCNAVAFESHDHTLSRVNRFGIRVRQMLIARRHVVGERRLNDCVLCMFVCFQGFDELLDVPGEIVRYFNKLVELMAQ